MDKLDLVMLADDLQLTQDEVLHGDQVFDEEKVYQALDQLQVLDKPVKDYFSLTQDEYYSSESDHRLTLSDLQTPLVELHDRVLTNHVDGYVDQQEINLTYNHEDPFADGAYSKKVDYQVITYSLKVIAAVDRIAPAQLKQVLSKDAVLSIALAAYALKHN